MRKSITKMWKGILLAVFFVMCTPQLAEATQQRGAGISELEDVTNEGVLIEPDTEEFVCRAGNGTIHWEPAVVDEEWNLISPAKLTLNNATITTGAKKAIDIFYVRDITVEVIGTNRISSNNEETVYIVRDDEYYTVTITGTGTLEMATSFPYERSAVWTDVNMCITGGVTVSVSDCLLVNDLTVDNAAVSSGMLAVRNTLHVKSGIVDVENAAVGSDLGLWATGKVLVDRGATLNAGVIGIAGSMKKEGEVNSLVYEVKDPTKLEVHGDLVVTDGCTLQGCLQDELADKVVISEGATLTVAEGSSLDLSDKELEFAENAALVVEGSVTLPAGTLPEDIEKMNVTGEGVVVVAGSSDTEGTTEEKVYTTDGSALNATESLDFMNVGTGSGQTPPTGDGYIWDAGTKTLTLSDAYMEGALNLPTESKIVISGVNIVTKEVTVAGNTSDAFTLSGEGTLKVGGKKYVSHIYGEPTFTWAETKAGYSAKATFVCLGGEDIQTVDAKVTLSKKNPTCKEEGVLTYTAQVSFAGKGYTETKKITSYKAEHTWDKGTVTKNATNTAKAEMTYTCTICQEKKVETVKSLKVGMLIKDAKAIYKVTKAGAKSRTVEYVKPVKKNVKTVSIPATIKAGGVTYKVTSIGAKACKGYKKLTSVTIGKNVKSVGKEAFYKCKKLKNITIKSKELKTSKIGKNAFKGIKSSATIRVPAKKYRSYKTMLRKKGVGKKAKYKKI